VIHLDTSVLVDAFTAARRSEHAVRDAIEAGERLVISTIVLYEWLRGPRIAEELRLQEAVLPPDTSVVFGPEEAAVAAAVYRRLPRARGREIDIAVASCAIARDAALWTLNADDFRDIPGLRLYTSPAAREEDRR
jgi:predicted nucleic acid-binding protein